MRQGEPTRGQPQITSQRDDVTREVSGVERRSNKSRRTSEPYRADPVISRDRLFDG